MPKFLHSATIRLFSIVMNKGAELASAERRSELGFDALVDEVLKESFSLAQYSPEGAYPWWEGVCDLFDMFNGRLADVGAPQLEAPTYERYMELLAQFEADDEAAMSDATRKAVKKWARSVGWTAEHAADVRARAVSVAKVTTASLAVLAAPKSSPASDADERQ